MVQHIIFNQHVISFAKLEIGKKKKSEFYERIFNKPFYLFCKQRFGQGENNIRGLVRS